MVVEAGHVDLEILGMDVVDPVAELVDTAPTSIICQMRWDGSRFSPTVGPNSSNIVRHIAGE